MQNFSHKYYAVYVIIFRVTEILEDWEKRNEQMKSNQSMEPLKKMRGGRNIEFNIDILLKDYLIEYCKALKS